MDCFSLRSTRYEERSSSRIPPDPNETSAIARHAPTQYSSDTGSTRSASLWLARSLRTYFRD